MRPISLRKKIFVTCQRDCDSKDVEDYVYTLSYDGNYQMNLLSAEEVKEIIACFQHALELHEKGGAK